MTYLANTRPDPPEYAPYYKRYVDLVPEADVLAALARQAGETLAYLRSLPEAAGDQRYAPGKWSVKEVVGHMIDTERVFAHRALFFARRDPSPLPGFEQDDWAAASANGAQSLGDLATEFEHVRAGNLYFFRHLDEEAWGRSGTASGCEFSVRALAYVILGHERYHLDILRTRYSV